MYLLRCFPGGITVIFNMLKKLTFWENYGIDDCFSFHKKIELIARACEGIQYPFRFVTNCQCRIVTIVKYLQCAILTQKMLYLRPFDSSKLFLLIFSRWDYLRMWTTNYRAGLNEEYQWVDPLNGGSLSRGPNLRCDCSHDSKYITSDTDCAINNSNKPVIRIDTTSCQPMARLKQAGMVLDVV